MIPKGAKEGVSFPELTVFASNIDDVEIISSTANFGASVSAGGGGKVASSAKAQSSNPVAVAAKTNKAKTTSSPATHSIHATPSVYANQTHTFPSGNARKTLPSEEFDFAANLARFDKANEFKKIQADDLVPKGDRLVSINSPQRKLGIRESVLDKGEGNGNTSSAVVSTNGKNIKTSTTPPPTSVNDEIMEKFKHLTVVASKPVGKSSPLLVEEGSSSEDEPCDKNEKLDSNGDNRVVVPMINSNYYDQYCLNNAGVLDSIRTISAVNFAHHLLAELDPSNVLVLLLGVGEPSAILMESFYHLCNNSRMKSTEIIAIFAAGGVGSGGKRIELSSAVKSARKKLINQNRVKFTTSLNEIVKIQPGNVVVFDSLGYDGELTSNAEKGLTEWMKKITRKSGKFSVYGIESSLLRKQPKNESFTNLQLVTFGIARDTIVSSLKVSNSILYVDSGISKETYKEAFCIESDEIFSESFVVEIEY